MQISLDNINFYQPHRPNSARPTSTTAWKLCKPPALPRFLEYPVPTRYIPTKTAAPTFTEMQDVQQLQVPRIEHHNSQATPPRNVFDVELEANFEAGDSQSISDGMVDDYRLRNESALPTDLTTTEPTKRANGADNVGLDTQRTTEQPERHALNHQSAQETQPSKAADCSLNPSVEWASSRPVYSDALSGNAPCVERDSATSSDHLGGDPHDLLLSMATEDIAPEFEPTLPDSPSTCESGPSSPGRVDDEPRRESVALGESDQSQEVITDDTEAETTTCYGETGDHFGGDPHDLLSMATEDIAPEFEPTLPNNPSICEFGPPSLGRLDNEPRRESAALEGSVQCQEVVVDHTEAEATACYGETTDLAEENLTDQHPEINGLVSAQSVQNLEERPDDLTPAMSRNQHLQPVTPPKVSSTHDRSLRHRHERSGSRTQSSSVAVVIPVRRSHRLMTGNTERPKGLGHRARDKRDDDLTTESRKTDQSFSSSGRGEGCEHPRKRRKHTSQSRRPTCNNPKSAGLTTGHLTSASQQSPDPSYVASPKETEEFFGRGILRIQSHGPRRAYFITFLPDAAHCEPMQLSSETPRGSSQNSNATSECQSKRRQSAHRSSSKRSRRSSVTETEDEDVRFVRHRIQQDGATRSRDNKQPRVTSRKGMPWSREEENLLKILRKDRNLPWSVVARCFTKQFPGRSQGSLQVYWSSHM